MGLRTLPHHEQLLLKEPWLLRMGSLSGFRSLPLGFGALPWRVALLGLGVLGIGVVSLLLGSLGGSLLLPVTELDGPATGGSPITLWMLASWMGVCMFWGWRVAESEGGVDDCSLGNLLLMSCSHCWGGSGGEA